MAGARPLLGSSITSSSRGSISARAIATICFWPPLSLPAGCCQKVFSAGNRPNSQSSRCASRSARRLAERAASSRFSATVSAPKMPMVSGT
mmetsp:Transcript_1391/g.4076  ORF Transcript_1391/g.4076 Transcript_1391/m.4076 type:complete len:91 (+) Transcript_1391:303-575(+)